MIVTCNDCDSSFNVNDSLIKADGSKVRCSKCSSVFVVYPEAPESESGADADDLALDLDDGLEADLDSDDELADLDMDSGADDELPDLDGMMDFEDDEMSVEASAEEDAAGLDFDMDLEDDDSAEPGEDGDLDLEDLDMDFDLDEEGMAELEESDLGDFETDDADLPDLDMDLADLDEAAEADTAEAESGLDSGLEAEEEPVAAVEGGDDELDLSDLEDLVDADAEMDMEDVTMEADGAAAEDDLDLDLTDLDEAAEEDTAEAESGLDLGLEAEEEPLAAAEGGDDELDLSDLEDLVAADEDMGLEVTGIEDMEDLGLEATAIEDSEDLDLDLESEPEAEAVAAESDELDLSDLDDIIDSGDAPAGEEIAAGAGDDLDLELDLDLEAEPAAEAPEDGAAAAEAPAGAAEGADELDFSDLDLEGIAESDETPAEAADDLVLDFEVADETAGPAAQEAPAGTQPEELEMSDLERMLEPDEKPVSQDTDELDLELDLEPAGEQPTAPVESAAEPAGSDDAEFLDIEKMLEEGAEAEAADAGSEDLVELDLDAVMDGATQTEEPELELNLDLEPGDGSLNISATPEDDLEFNLVDSDEETMQFGATQAAVTQVVEELSESSDMDATTDDFSTDEFGQTRDEMDQTDYLDDVGPGPAMAGAMKTRKTRKPVMVAVLVLFLCILGIIVTNSLGVKIPYVSDIHIPYISDVRIPYLDGLLKTEPQDVAGNLKISPLGRTISHKFVENSRSGKIFVISGQVRNEYDHPRSNIRITGKLYQEGMTLAKTATVYCGNMLSDADLQRMDIRAIGKRLQNRFGDNRSNIKVKTGMTIPFVIVFNKLPDNLDEYTVEVAGSSG